MNHPYVIPYTSNTCRCRLIPGAMPPFNYTRHLHPYRLFELRLGYEVASTVKLKPIAINESGKNFPIQFAKLNGSSICNLLNLVWPQPMRLELPWKLKKFTVIEEY